MNERSRRTPVISNNITTENSIMTHKNVLKKFTTLYTFVVPLYRSIYPEKVNINEFIHNTAKIVKINIFDNSISVSSIKTARINHPIKKENPKVVSKSLNISYLVTNKLKYSRPSPCYFFVASLRVRL